MRSKAFFVTLLFACSASFSIGLAQCVRHFTSATLPVWLALDILAYALYYASCAGVCWFISEYVRGYGKVGHGYAFASAAFSFIAFLLRVIIYFSSDDLEDTLYCVEQAVSDAAILLGIYVLIRFGKRIPLKKKLMLILLLVLPFIALPIAFLQRGLVVSFALAVMSMLYIYVMVYYDLEEQIEQQKRVIRREKLIRAAERIKSHYIYNVLTTIYYLCDRDPKGAQLAVGSFSDYMRRTLDTVEGEELVPLEWEISLIKSYIDIEKKLYKDRFVVEYDIDSDDLLLPPISVQPLVENAVKHGMKRTENGGRIVIACRKTEKGHIITVTDNGSGPDSGNASERPHEALGISNVRERVELLTGGTVSVRANNGGGTVSEVFIPLSQIQKKLR